MFTTPVSFPPSASLGNPGSECELNPTHCGFQVLLASPSSPFFPQHPQEEFHGGLWASFDGRGGFRWQTPGLAHIPSVT